MKAKLLLASSIAIALLMVLILNKQKSDFKIPENIDLKVSTNSKDFTTAPLEECVVCMQGVSWDNKPCCNDNFDSECAAKNGVMRSFDLHPLFNSILKGCFQKLPDAGMMCAEGKECLSGICNLEYAIKSEKCRLIEKELTGKKNSYSGLNFYTASYSCTNVRPGICTEAVDDEQNPGGYNHVFKMEGNILVETLDSGPIN